MAFSQMLAMILRTPIVLDKKTKPYKQKKEKKKLASTLGIQTYQILTNNDEICIPNLSSMPLAVMCMSGI